MAATARLVDVAGQEVAAARPLFPLLLCVLSMVSSLILFPCSMSYSESEPIETVGPERTRPADFGKPRNKPTQKKVVRYGTITVHCKDSAGQPLDGIKLVLWADGSTSGEQDEQLWHITDASGDAVFDKKFRYKRPLTLTIDDGNWMTWKGSQSWQLPARKSRDETLPLILVPKARPVPPPPGRLTVTLLDPYKNPVPGVAVELAADDGQGDEKAHSLHATTDAFGQAVFSKEYRRDRTLRVRLHSDEWSLTNITEYVSRKRGLTPKPIELSVERDVVDYEVTTSPEGGEIYLGDKLVKDGEFTLRLTELQRPVLVRAELTTDLAVLKSEMSLQQGDRYDLNAVEIPLKLIALRQLDIASGVEVADSFETVSARLGPLRDGELDVHRNLDTGPGAEMQYDFSRVTADGSLQVNVKDNQIRSVYLLSQGAGVVGGVRVDDKTASVFGKLGEPDDTDGTTIQLPAGSKSESMDDQHRIRCRIGMYMDDGIWFYSAGRSSDGDPKMLMIAIFKPTRELLGE